MPTEMLWDELNTFKSIVELTGAASSASEQKKKETQDDLLDILIMAYIVGYQDAGVELGMELIPDPDLMQQAVYKDIAGKNFEQRVSEYVDSGTVEDILRVAETDVTRIYNTAVVDAGKRSGAGGLKKTWQTMLDDRVRSTHEYLQSKTVGIDEEFFTWDGDHAPYPGGFEDPSNNVNCRCYITISRD